MKPFPGYNRAELTGGLEWQWEREYTRDGIPISLDHQESLEKIATKLEIETPFAKYERTRFNSYTTRMLPTWVSRTARRFAGRG